MTVTLAPIRPPIRPEIIHEETWMGSQSHEHKGLYRYRPLSGGDHLLRVTRKRDSYPTQSYVHLERWDGSKWQYLDYIPYPKMTDDSQHRPSHQEDVKVLLDRAMVLLDS